MLRGQHTKENGRNHEEVGGDHILMVGKEGPPSPPRWFSTARHVLATAASESSNPSFESSPWMRGAPQRGLAKIILRIRSMTFRGVQGRP